MNTQHNFRTFFGRKSIFKHILLGTFVSIASYPRMLIEVFVRRNFGERYFKMISAVTIAILLALIPAIQHKMASLASMDAFGGGSNFWLQYASWYVFLLAFLYFSWKRFQEIKCLPSIFELARFTQYAGDMDTRFFDIKLFGKEPTVRMVAIYLEPAVFLIAGLLLHLFGQALGMLLIVTSVCYCLSYAGAFMQGDEKMSDMLDDILINQQLHNIIIGNQPPHKTKGVSLDARLPEAPEDRQTLYDYIRKDFDENDDSSIAV